MTFFLIGGPPRVGKSTLAALLLRRGIAGCPTDVLVTMLQNGAPLLGIRHGTHPDKASSIQSLLLEFVGCFRDPDADYFLEGDVVTPELADLATARNGKVRAVFLGHTSLNVAELRIAPHWLEHAEDAEYERIRDWIIERSLRLREQCARTGHEFVDMSSGRDQGLSTAYAQLTGG